MPGVPSSKGCDACRKQKKKCDQAKPACARCTRLNIACVGGGKQRYKFKVQVAQRDGPVFVDDSSSSSKAGSASGFSSSPSSDASSLTPALVRLPSSQTMLATQAFVTRLEMPDIRYDLTCFGDFLRHLPSRFGDNEALDASVDVLVSTFAYAQTAPGDKPVAAMRKYGNALNKLRICLSDPKKVKTANTLCAVYILLICQGWLGDDGTTPSHGEGLAYLLRATASENWKSGFETEMIISFCVPVVIESIINPRIILDKWFWDILAKFQKKNPNKNTARKDAEKQGNPLPSLAIENLAMIPDYLRYPEKYRAEIMYAYHRLRVDVEKMSKALIALRLPPGYNASFRELRNERVFNAAYMILLCFAIVLNKILQAFDPIDIGLVAEMAYYSTEAIALSEYARPQRPLGASYIPMCLSTVWGANDEPGMKNQLAELMAEYQADVRTTSLRQSAEWWQWKFDDFKVRLAPPETRSLVMVMTQQTGPKAPKDCCVM